MTEASLPGVNRVGQFDHGQALRRQDRVRILLVVEGVNDIAFLRRMAVILNGDDQSLPNLAEWETCGELVFLPTGGVSETWGERLAPLDRPEFHLLDRELPPETEQRREMVTRINRRSDCRAVLTGKRSLENYLHPNAILAASGLSLRFGDFDSVAQMAAKHAFEAKAPDAAWASLSARTQKRLIYRAKRWLNRRAVEQMTPAMLAVRDPRGEVISWLRTIGDLAAL